VPLIRQCRGQVRPDKTVGAGDDSFHDSTLP